MPLEKRLTRWTTIHANVDPKEMMQIIHSLANGYNLSIAEFMSDLEEKRLAAFRRAVHCDQTLYVWCDCGNLLVAEGEALALEEKKAQLPVPTKSPTCRRAPKILRAFVRGEVVLVRMACPDCGAHAPVVCPSCKRSYRAGAFAATYDDKHPGEFLYHMQRHGYIVHADGNVTPPGTVIETPETEAEP